jgi:hypothetical protein
MKAAFVIVLMWVALATTTKNSRNQARRWIDDEGDRQEWDGNLVARNRPTHFSDSRAMAEPGALFDGNEIAVDQIQRNGDRRALSSSSVVTRRASLASRPNYVRRGLALAMIMLILLPVSLASMFSALVVMAAGPARRFDGNSGDCFSVNGNRIAGLEPTGSAVPSVTFFNDYNCQGHSVGASGARSVRFDGPRGSPLDTLRSASSRKLLASKLAPPPELMVKNTVNPTQVQLKGVTSTVSRLYMH